jgi:hypothetical protein
MENHGYVFLTPWDIKWAQMCTDLLEMTAKHIIHARTLGDNIKGIGCDDLRDMGNVMTTRRLSLPGAPGAWDSLDDLFYSDAPPQV